MSFFQQLLSMIIALPEGVAPLGQLILAVLGISLVAGGVHCWARWRKLTK